MRYNVFLRRYKRKYKNGFTLIELIGVLVILLVIFIISYPVISMMINNSNENLANATKELIFASTNDYLKEKEDIYIPNIENTYCVFFEQLKDYNKITENQLLNIDPKYTAVEVKYDEKENTVLKLKETCTEKVVTARLELIGSSKVKINLTSDGSIREYTEKGLYYYDGINETPTKLEFSLYNPTINGLTIMSLSQKTNEKVLCDATNNCIPQTELTSYVITYKYEAPDGNIVKTERMIRVVDEEPPVINVLIPEETISLYSTSYDVNSGIEVTDNSNDKVDVEVSTTLSLKKEGTYLIKYKAKDLSGNTSEASRKVIVKKSNAITLKVNPNKENIEVHTRTYGEEDILKGVKVEDEKGNEYPEVITYTIEKNSSPVSKVDTDSLGTYIVSYGIIDDSIKITNTRTINVVDTTKPEVSVSVSGSTATINFSDNVAVSGWAVSESPTTEPTFTEINPTPSSSKTVTATKGGKYYAWVRDTSGNVNYEEYEIAATAICSVAVNKKWSYSFDGTTKSLTIPCDGTYQLDLYGASGGNTSVHQYSSTGGYGGHSKGTVYLTAGTKIYITVGQGGSTTLPAGVTIGATTAPFNGGGAGAKLNNGWYYIEAASGGGATHVALASGQLSSLSGKKDKVLLVAGGGGGSVITHENINHDSNTPEDLRAAYSSFGAVGGYGGGTYSDGNNFNYNGGDGTSVTKRMWCGGSDKSTDGNLFEKDKNYQVEKGGTGATTSKGGSGTGNGSFGQGGANDLYTKPGGGGGYYGGGSGSGGSLVYAAGGGSAYVASTVTPISVSKCTSCIGNGKAEIKLISIGQ